MNPRHLYVHVPYCVSKCPYCDFNSIAGRDGEFAAYVEALLSEVRTLPAGPYATIFIGGGTPSLLPPALIERLCAGIRAHCQLLADYEWTMEANPASVDRESFAAARNNGVNRISIGVQSVHEHHLRFLGRAHSPADAERAVALAQSLFPRVSCDLMIGLPGQTMHELDSELDWYRRHQLDHASVYHLAIEAGTEFYARYQKGLLQEIAEDCSEAMLMQVAQQLGALGLHAYETSNYSRPGEECRHNLAYWWQQDYHAAGAGAVSTVAGVRRTRRKHPGLYIAAVNEGRGLIEQEERLSPVEMITECWMLGLRLQQGVRRDRLRQLGDNESRWLGQAEELRGFGMLEYNDQRVWLSEAGRRVQDAVTVALLPDQETAQAAVASNIAFDQPLQQ